MGSMVQLQRKKGRTWAGKVDGRRKQKMERRRREECCTLTMRALYTQYVAITRRAGDDDYGDCHCYGFPVSETKAEIISVPTRGGRKV